MRERGMQAGDRRRRSWRSSRELAYGGNLETGSFPGAEQNGVGRCVLGAEAKAPDFEVIGPPAVAANFSGGAPRISNDEIGLGHSAYLAGCDPPGGALNARSPREC